MLCSRSPSGGGRRRGALDRQGGSMQEGQGRNGAGAATGAPRIIIIGAGPTGLGAAYRLKELGHTDFMVYESSPYVGGLAHSFTDEKGFTWDIGGHVMFSH